MITEPKLRIGIMCGGASLAAWEKKCIDEILAAEYGVVSLIILDAPENYPTRTLGEKIRSIGFNKAFFQCYLRLFYKPASLVRVNIDEWFATAPQISCKVTMKGKFSQYFSAADVEAIKGHNLDIIFRFGFNIIRGAVLQTARYGIWSFHHDDELKYRGGPPCFWEIYHKDPETGAVLQQLTDKLDGGVILKKGIFRTKSYSYQKNIDQVYFESANWPAYVCKDILGGNAAYIQHAPTVTTAPIYKHPTNAQFLRFLMIMLQQTANAAIFRMFTMQKWNVGRYKGSIQDLLSDKNPTFDYLDHQHKDTFNADCFGHVRDGKHYIFFEELDYKNGGRGVIKVCVADKGKPKQYLPVAGLPEDVHLSYPYIFEATDAIYMIPETAGKKAISLYKASRFPDVWEQVAILKQGESYVDTTLLYHDGTYWLFYTINSDKYDGDMHLHLAFSDNIDGPYHEHPGNPVKISARSGRPAGTPFLDEQNILVRPAQNFTRTYGGSIVLNKITRLTKHSFEEEEMREILPLDAYYKDGIHTVAVLNNKEVLVDMKRHLFRPFWAFKK